MWPPQDDLAPFVSGYHLYVVDNNDGEPQRGAFEPALASLRIAVTGGAKWQLRKARGDWFTPPQVSLFGPTSEVVWSQSGAGFLVGAGIRPRCWPRLFSAPAGHWADRISQPPFARAEALQLIETHFSTLQSDDDVPRAFDAVIRALLHPPGADDTAIGRIEAALVDPAITSVEELTRVTGLSLRQLQRLARRAFGFRPKVLLRRARFLRSLHALRAAGRREGATIIDPSYTDYSHFIRDSHFFLGMSPQAFLERDMPLLKRSLELRAKVLGTPAQVLDPVPPARSTSPGRTDLA
ncbi:AraC family transcriptional regulator [Tsuneonella deserti]|nr:helix-turn-helix domain-containing protein [Tsuneonella deserti]